MQRPVKKKSRREAALEPALLRAVERRTLLVGAVEFPAVPALANHFTRKVLDLCPGFGHMFTTNETDGLRSLLGRALVQGYAVSSEARLVFQFKTPPGKGIEYEVKIRHPSMEEHYETWASMRKPPLFGKACCQISVDCRGRVVECESRSLEEIPADCREAAVSWAARHGSKSSE